MENKLQIQKKSSDTEIQQAEYVRNRTGILQMQTNNFGRLKRSVINSVKAIPIPRTF